ncbi:hypothetical protein NG827_02510 [Xanthomonas sacchari]|uniref:lipase family protein n=1 Tax=Xanthomonas sacchari TaxID=56458 RepID=UPI00225ABC6F|nr:hypothetical protein [Xanthomonas sacchari]UYK85309.1 hypothetical protein NG827_02510 [Xanthomonas sacchari]
MQYDQYQTVFALSSLANWVSFRFGSAEQLQKDYQKTILATLASPVAQQTIGNWELVWGPQVWQADGSKVSDNAMYVAKSSNLGSLAGDVYVVAIAATNPISHYDWYMEDFGVNQVVDFSNYDPTAHTEPVPLSSPTEANTVISLGTALGVWRLLNMASPSSVESQGDTLATFLKNVASSGATVIFAGHSLGGALSPTVATWLKSNHWLDGSKAVYCYPTAGATPGNAAFAELFNTTLPPTTGDGYRVWNRDVWNSYDVVPHAWDTGMLAQISTLYGNKPIPLIDEEVKKAIANAELSKISYKQIPNQELLGTPGAVPTTALGFMIEAKNQHTKAYASLIAPHIKPVLPPPQELLTLEMDEDAELYALLLRLQAKSGASALAQS